MGKKLTLAERQRNEFEKEVKKQIIVAREQQQIATACDEAVLKRVMRAYDIAEMRVALYEAQHSE